MEEKKPELNQIVDCLIRYIDNNINGLGDNQDFIQLMNTSKKLQTGMKSESMKCYYL